MRHLHFTQSLEPLQGGGLGASAVALHDQFRASGLHSVLCSTHGGTPQRPKDGTLEFPRIKPDFIYYSRAMQRQAPHLVREADVVHGHGLYVGSNFIFGREARRQGKPLVYHVQGMFDPWILRRSRWKKKLVHFFFEERNVRACRLWRALTGKEADQIRSLGFTAPVVVAPNGVHLEDYDVVLPTHGRSRLNLPERIQTKRWLVFMARLHPKKGLDLLLPAWSRMTHQHQDWELIIAGPDEGGYLATIKSLISQLKLESNTTLPGPVTGQTKLDLLKEADLFILPSYSEGLPVAVLEAMACHLPVVATHEANIPELETEGGGWLCETNIDSVHQKLSQALECSEAEQKSRGLAARALVERRYTWPGISAVIESACNLHCF
jgi:glycosyltransferase involved in cell wall biosynthesis